MVVTEDVAERDCKDSDVGSSLELGVTAEDGEVFFGADSKDRFAAGGFGAFTMCILVILLIDAIGNTGAFIYDCIGPGFSGQSFCSHMVPALCGFTLIALIFMRCACIIRCGGCIFACKAAYILALYISWCSVFYGWMGGISIWNAEKSTDPSATADPNEEIFGHFSHCFSILISLIATCVMYRAANELECG